MKKSLVLSLLSLLMLTGFGQKFTSSLDKFTNQKKISSDKVRLWGAGFTSNGVEVSIRSVDTSIYLMLKGNSSGTVGEHDPLYFLTDSGTVILFPTHLQTSSRFWNVNYWMEYYEFQYRISYKDVVLLSESNIKSIRRYYNDVYQEFDIRESHRSNVINLCTAFLTEYNKK